MSKFQCVRCQDYTDDPASHTQVVHPEIAEAMTYADTLRYFRLISFQRERDMRQKAEEIENQEPLLDENGEPEESDAKPLSVVKS